MYYYGANNGRSGTARSARVSLDDNAASSGAHALPSHAVSGPGGGGNGGSHLGSGVEYLLPASLRHDSVIGARVLHAAVDRGSQGLSSAFRSVSPEAVLSLALELGMALERAEPWAEAGAEGQEEGEERGEVGGGEGGYLMRRGEGESTGEYCGEAEDAVHPLRGQPWDSDLPATCSGGGGGGGGAGAGGGGGTSGASSLRSQQRSLLHLQGSPAQMLAHMHSTSRTSLLHRPPSNLGAHGQSPAAPHANGPAILQSQGSAVLSLYQQQLQQQAQTQGRGARGLVRRMTGSVDEPSSVKEQDSGLEEAETRCSRASNVRMRLSLLWKVLTNVARRRPWVLATPLVLWLLLCGLGVFGVAYASDKYISNQKAYAQEAVASATASSISNQLEIATFAIMAMSAYVSQHPLCSDLDRNFHNLSSVVLNWDDKGLVYQLQALPAAVLNYIHPPLSPELAQLILGRDLLRVDMYRNDTLYQVQQRDQRLLLGPYSLLEGFQGMFATYPIFLPAPDALYDWGCGVQPYQCPLGVCWIPGEGKKLWGLATSVLSLDNMQADFRFKSLEQQGYRYRLRQLPDNINGAAVIAVSDPPPSSPIATTVHKFNLVWLLEVSPGGGWEPAWRAPCIAAVVVGSAAVSALVLWLLLAREKHDALLNAMLPRKVIKQLQRGDQTVVEEFMEPVTILFSDIVSYTEVASQLTALQVVRLLNELYTRFDALCDKHGVYKVETIGDAFMCVAGCPARENPVNAAVRMAGMAQDMVAMVEGFSARVGSEEMRVKIRIGLHSGPVVAGVIGQRMPRYCLFGDTVNTASRMETNSQPMCIHLSASTASLLRMAGASVMLPVRPPPPANASMRPAAPHSPLGISRPSPGARRPPLTSASGDLAHSSSRDPATLSLILEQNDTLSAELWQQPLSFPQAPAQALASEPHVQQFPLPQQQQQQQQQQVLQRQRTTGDSGEVWRLAARGHEGLVPPLTLFGRGRVMIKGKGMMHTFWLGSPPPPPSQAETPARPPAPASPPRGTVPASLSLRTSMAAPGRTPSGRGAALEAAIEPPTSQPIKSAPGRLRVRAPAVASAPPTLVPSEPEGSFRGVLAAVPVELPDLASLPHRTASLAQFTFAAAFETEAPSVGDAAVQELLPAAAAAAAAAEGQELVAVVAVAVAGEGADAGTGALQGAGNVLSEVPAAGAAGAERQPRGRALAAVPGGVSSVFSSIGKGGTKPLGRSSAADQEADGTQEGAVYEREMGDATSGIDISFR